MPDMPTPTNYTPIVGSNQVNEKNWENPIAAWFRSLPHRGYKFWLTVAAILITSALVVLFVVHGLTRAQGPPVLRSRRPYPTEIGPGPPQMLKQNPPMSGSKVPAKSAMAPGQNKMVLIDTDAGVDDAWALIMLLRAHQDPTIPLTIVGITTVAGNTHLNNVIINVQRVLEMMGEEKIPMYKGAEEALVHPLQPSDYFFFGNDGFGDATWPRPPLNHSYVKSQPAANAIVDLAKKYKDGPEKLTILAIGPLTNVATAFRLEPNLKTMIKEIHFLGGNWEGMGNIGMAAEFNAYADAEAAQIVIDSVTPLSLHVVPWELCFYNLLEYSFRADMGKMMTKEIAFLNKIEATSLAENTDKWLSGDSLASALLLEPMIAGRTDLYWTAMELTGNWTRGMMVVDRRAGNGKDPNASFTVRLNVEAYQKIMIWAAGGPSYKPLV